MLEGESLMMKISNDGKLILANQNLIIKILKKKRKKFQIEQINLGHYK